jgi:hypothetical protein
MHPTDGWESAARIARAHDGGVMPLTPHPRVKYLFAIGHWYLLVHRGRVITEQGTTVLDSYLQEIAVEDRRALQVDDLTTLVRLLGAFPPIADRDPLQFVDDPQLTWSGDRGAFELRYDVTRHPARARFVVWTLTIAADGRISWTEKLPVS